MACRAVLAHAGVWASLFSLSLAVLLVHALARWQFWGRQLLTICVRLALSLPPVVAGYVLVPVFGQRALVGCTLMIPLVSFMFRRAGAVLAATVMAFSLVVRAIRLAIEAVDSKLEEAATTIGARAIWAFLTITVPLMAASLAAGWFWPSPKLWENLRQQSPLWQIYRVRRKHCH